MTDIIQRKRNSLRLDSSWRKYRQEGCSDWTGYKIKRWKCAAIHPFSEAPRGDVTGTCCCASPGTAAEPQRCPPEAPLSNEQTTVNRRSSVCSLSQRRCWLCSKMEFVRRCLPRRTDWTVQRRTCSLTVRFQAASLPFLLLLLLTLTNITFISAETVSSICRQKCRSSEVSYLIIRGIPCWILSSNFVATKSLPADFAGLFILFLCLLVFFSF